MRIYRASDKYLNATSNEEKLISSAKILFPAKLQPNGYHVRDRENYYASDEVWLGEGYEKYNLMVHGDVPKSSLFLKQWMIKFLPILIEKGSFLKCWSKIFSSHGMRVTRRKRSNLQNSNPRSVCCKISQYWETKEVQMLQVWAISYNKIQQQPGYSYNRTYICENYSLGRDHCAGPAVEVSGC